MDEEDQNFDTHPQDEHAAGAEPGAPPGPETYAEAGAAYCVADDPVGKPAEMQAAEPTAAALHADAQSAIIDGVVALAGLISHAQASMAQLIDQAREWNEITAHSVVLPNESMGEFEVQQLAYRSFVFELACALRIPESTANALIKDSDMLLHELPGTFKALADGEISYRHAQLLIDQALTLGPESRLQFEESVLDAAKTLTPSKFNTKARKLRERLHPESIVVRRATAFERRRIEFQPDLDGMAWVNMYQPAEAAMAFYNAVRQQAMRLQRADEPRTLTQLSLDVAVDAMLDGIQSDPALGAVSPMECGCRGADTEAHGESSSEPEPAASAKANTKGKAHKPKSGRRLRGIKPTVIVTVPVLTLLGKSDEPAQLDGYGPIDPDTARELAGEATSFIRLLVHPETGVPLSLSRDRYQVPKDLRLALSIRDGTCRGYGCNRSTATCDIDHTVAWQFGGKTHFDNLAHQCRHHHRLKHQTTWESRQMADGFIEWTSPLKRKYVTAPDIFLSSSSSSSLMANQRKPVEQQDWSDQNRPDRDRPDRDRPDRDRPDRDQPDHDPSDDVPPF